MRDRGNIYSPFADRAKEYAWNICLQYAPSNITPTDIDYMVERNSHFLFFEMKTCGTVMPDGQRLAFYRLLTELADKSVLMIVEHEPLDRVTMPTEILSFSMVRFNGSKFLKMADLPAESFAAMYAAFFDWAGGDRTAFARASETNEAAHRIFYPEKLAS